MSGCRSAHQHTVIICLLLWLSVCLRVCVCAHILSVTSGVISTAIIIHGRSAVKSCRLHSCMSRTKMQSSTFSNTRLLWAAVASYITIVWIKASLCFMNEECVRVTLRSTCTNYLKTQQSTDRTQTSHHATFQASSCGNILVVQASTKPHTAFCVFPSGH